jgi:hypothetical protein
MTEVVVTRQLLDEYAERRRLRNIEIKTYGGSAFLRHSLRCFRCKKKLEEGDRVVERMRGQDKFYFCMECYNTRLVET